MNNILDQLKVFIKPTDIYTSQRLMLYLLKWTGFLPLRIAGNRNQRHLRASVIAYAVATIILVFNLACFGITFFHRESLMKMFHHSRLSEFAGALEYLSMLTVTILLYGSCLCSTKKIHTCMQNIFNIDRKLNLLGIEISYWHGFYFNIVTITCFVTTHFAITLIMNVFINESIVESHPDFRLEVWATLFTHHLPIVLTSLIISYFSGIAFEVQKRFEAMNRVRFCHLSGVTL